MGEKLNALCYESVLVLKLSINRTAATPHLPTTINKVT